MRRFLKRVGGLWGAITLFCALAVIIGQVQPPSDDFYGIRHCGSALCSAEIVPGLSDWSRIRAMSSLANYSDDVAIPAEAGTLIFRRSAVIDSVSTVTEVFDHEQYPVLTEVFVHYGEPCAIAKSSLMDEVVLRYRDLKVTALSHRIGNAFSIEASARILTITFNNRPDSCAVANTIYDFAWRGVGAIYGKTFR